MEPEILMPCSQEIRHCSLSQARRVQPTPLYPNSARIILLWHGSWKTGIVEPEETTAVRWQPITRVRGNEYERNKRRTERERRCFLFGPYRGYRVNTIEAAVRWWPAGNDVSTRAQESSLLGTVTEQRLVKSTTDGDSACYNNLLSV
jgi:hypothetical protein